MLIRLDVKRMKWINYKGKRIYAYADTHGKPHTLPEDADIIICAGDIGLYTEQDAVAYMRRLGECSCPLILFVPGNHDLFFDFEPEQSTKLLPPNVYLLQGEYIYGGIRLYGLTAVPWLHHPCVLPKGIDILVTHGAPKDYLDEGCGCPLLAEAIKHHSPQLHIFGHAHEAFGEIFDKYFGTRFVNVSSYNLLT